MTHDHSDLSQMMERVAMAITVEIGWGAFDQFNPNHLRRISKVVLEVSRHDELVEALKEARAVLHQHYVDWDGDPEDAVPLQLARAKCDAVLAKIGGAA